MSTQVEGGVGQLDGSQEYVEIMNLKEKLRLAEYEKKKRTMEFQSQLESQMDKTEEYKTKYEYELNGKGSDEQIGQLLKKLKDREDELLEIKAKDIETKARLATKYKDMHFKSNQKLEGHVAQLIAQNKMLSQKIEEIKEGAIQAIMERQDTIDILTERNSTLQDITHSLAYLQLKDEYQQLSDKYNRQVRQYQQKLKQKKTDITHLIERIEKDSVEYQDKLAKLENDLQYRMNTNIKEVLTTFRTNQDNLLNDLQNLQSTLYKFQTRSNELSIQNEVIKAQIQTQKRRSKSQLDSLLFSHNQQISRLHKGFQQAIKVKDREIADSLAIFNERLKVELHKRVSQEADERRNFQEVMAVKSRKMSAGSGKFQYGQSFSQEQPQQDQEKSISKELIQIKDLQENTFYVNEWSATKDVVQDFETTLQNHNLSPQETPSQKLSDSKDLEETDKLKDQLEEAYSTISDLNKNVTVLTRQIQQNREVISDLKKQFNRGQKETALRLQLQGLKLHLSSIQNALLVEKWKHNELVEYYKQEMEAKKIDYNQQLVRASSRKASKA